MLCGFVALGGTVWGTILIAVIRATVVTGGWSTPGAGPASATRVGTSFGTSMNPTSAKLLRTLWIMVSTMSRITLPHWVLSTGALFVATHAGLTVGVGRGGTAGAPSQSEKE